MSIGLTQQVLWYRCWELINSPLVAVSLACVHVLVGSTDTEPIASEPNHVPIILGRPFLATANAIINFRNGVMQLTFSNMTLELNIFHLNNKQNLLETENQIYDEVVSITTTYQLLCSGYLAAVSKPLQ